MRLADAAHDKDKKSADYSGICNKWVLHTDGSDMATYCGASHVDVILKCCSRDLDMLRGIKGQINEQQTHIRGMSFLKATLSKSPWSNFEHQCHMSSCCFCDGQEGGLGRNSDFPRC